MASQTTHRRKERLDRGIKVRTDGVYAISSWREITYMLAPRLLLILGVLALPLILTVAPYWQKVLVTAAIFALLAMGFDFLSNYVGLVSLGGGFFIGVGAYIAALLNTELGWPPAVTIPAATILGAMVCTLLFWPALPLRGVYFAIVSLMYPMLAARLIEALDVFGGTDGVIGVGGLPNKWVEQYALIVMVMIFLFALRRFVNEDIGLIFRGVKDNDQAVKASGINITTVKAMGVFIASAMGCMGGAFLAHTYMWAGISQFAMDFSILPIAATVVGGGGTLVGPVLGTMILVPISEYLRDFGTLRIAIYALILVVFIVFKSEGLMNYGTRKYQQFEHWVDV